MAAVKKHLNDRTYNFNTWKEAAEDTAKLQKWSLDASTFNLSTNRKVNTLSIKKKLLQNYQNTLQKKALILLRKDTHKWLNRRPASRVSSKDQRLQMADHRLH